MDELVGSKETDNSKYCFAKPGEIYLVYIAKISSLEAGSFELDLSDTPGEFSIDWYNPRSGGDLMQGQQLAVTGGRKVKIVSTKSGDDDWLAIIKRK